MNIDCKQQPAVFPAKILVWVSLSLLLSTLPSATQAGQSPATQAPDNITIDSTVGVSGRQHSDLKSSGTISGKVVDQSGAPIAEAHVTLARDGQSQDREALTDDDGQFFLADVAPGLVQLTVTAEGLASQTLYQTLAAGQACVIPNITLSVATQMTQVIVGVTPAERAEDEVRQEEKQRVFGFIPNFFVSYEPRPVPLTAKMKFELAWKSASDPFTLGAIGAVAGVEQATNQWKGYGQGAAGYSKRYAASYADVFAGTYIGGAILPSVFKQDPRYFYKGTGSKRSRLLHALASSIICRSDSGRLEPNYSNIGGAFATGGLANLYYPASQRNGARVVLSTALIRIGETAAAGVFQEFFSRKMTPNLAARSQTDP